MHGKLSQVCISWFLKKWAKWLPLAEFWYNISFHSFLNMSPFQALYGSKPLLQTTVAIPTYVATVEDTLTQRAEMDSILKESLTRAQHRMKQL